MLIEIHVIISIVEKFTPSTTIILSTETVGLTIHIDTLTSMITPESET
jgi:hypothetical protein